MAMNAAQREQIEPMGSARSWLAFYARRFFRLAPSYYLSMIVAVCTAPVFLQGYKALQLVNIGFWGTGGGPYDPDLIQYTTSNLLAHVTLMFGISPRFTNSMMLPDWSLSLEMQYYLAFPFIFITFRKFGPVKTAIALSVLALPLAILARDIFVEPSFLPLKISLFAAGMMLAQLRFYRISMIKSAIIVALTVILTSMQFNAYSDGSRLILFVISSLFALLTLPAFSQIPMFRYLNAILSSRAAHFLSDASYGIYLFHGFFIAFSGYLFFTGDGNWVSGNERTAILFAITMPSSIITSYLIQNTVEKYGISVGRKIAISIDGKMLTQR